MYGNGFGLGPRPRDRCGLLVRGALLAIVEWDELRGAMPPLERPPEQLVRQPRVLRQARAVAVRADDLPLDRTLGPVLAVIAVTHEDRAEGRGLGADVRAAAVILEPDKDALGRPGHEIADETLLPCLRADVKHAEAGDRCSFFGQVFAPEELVAATHQEGSRAAGDRLAYRVAVRPHEVRADDVLADVLAAAEEEQIGPVRVERHARGVRANLDRDVTPPRALRERDDVAAVAVDAHEIGVKMRDAQVHHFFFATGFFAAGFFFAFAFAGSVSA